MVRLRRTVGLGLLIMCAVLLTQVDASAIQVVEPAIQLSDDGKKIEVTIAGERFTEFNYSDYSKPIFYPVELSPGVFMTRHFPMKEVAGEAADHPHHMSVWIGHEVNGLDFWSCKTGAIQFQEIESFDGDNREFTVKNHWVKRADESLVVVESTRYQVGADADSRWIDATIQFQAAGDAVMMDDTKEGVFAVRTHPSLRLSANPEQGVKKVTGQARNNEGGTGKAIWGKAAKWVDYSGTIDGQAVGICIFDHPENLRHPTTWHAREYGLVAANPFGLHYFRGEKKGAGAYRIPKGDSLTLRYRLLFYRGEFDAERTEQRFNAFAK